MRSWLAVLLLALSSFGCRARTGSPTHAVRALLDAVQADDVQAVWQQLGPRTRQRLVDDAERAGMQAGRRRVEPQDLLSVGWSLPRFTVNEVRQARRSDDQAVVEVSDGKQRAQVDVVLEQGSWKVELP